MPLGLRCDIHAKCAVLVPPFSLLRDIVPLVLKLEYQIINLISHVVYSN